MKTPSLAFLPCVLLMSTLGCDPKKSNDVDPDDESHDCTYYTPTIDLGELHDTWLDQDSENTASFTVPDDPGGGVVTLEMQTHNDAVPWLTVWIADPDPVGAVFSAHPAGEVDDTYLFARLEVGPGETYNVSTKEYGGSPLEDYPVSYDLTWYYASKVDCYEPNNDSSSAREIPINHEISAYIIGSKRNNANTMEGHDDWYSFTLTEDADVTVDFTSDALDDVHLVIGVVDPSTGAERGHGEIHNGTITAAAPHALPAGKHTLVVRPFSVPLYHALLDDDDPEHWSTEYSITVTTQPK